MIDFMRRKNQLFFKIFCLFFVFITKHFKKILILPQTNFRQINDRMGKSSKLKALTIYVCSTLSRLAFFEQTCLDKKDSSISIVFSLPTQTAQG